MAATVARATMAAKQHNLGKVTVSTTASSTTSTTASTTASAIAAKDCGRKPGEAKATGDGNGRDGNEKKTQTGLPEQDSLSSGMVGDESGGESR